MKYLLFAVCCILTSCHFSQKQNAGINMKTDSIANAETKMPSVPMTRQVLEGMIDEISRKVPLASDSIGFTMAYLEEPFQIVVALKDTSAQNIARFKREVMDSPLLVFKLGEDIVFE